jgi:hypothetical protein
MAAPLIVDPHGRPRDAKGNLLYPKLPIATYLKNAGLTERDAVRTEAAIFEQLREKIIIKARMDDAGERFRYYNDAQHRIRVNRELLGEVLLEFGFSRDELRVIEEGTQIGLLPKEVALPRARVIDETGREHHYDVEHLDDHRPDGGQLTKLTDVRTGEKQIV